MSEIDALHNKIGQILVDSGPTDAEKMVVRVDLPLDGDMYEYKFNYYDASKDKGWFVPDKNAIRDLRLTLLEMRQFFVDKDMTNGHPPWVGCEITIDLVNSKINISLDYGD